jgi:hypothetical protein
MINVSFSLMHFSLYYNNYDPKKLAELRNKTVVIPSNIDDVKKRTLKIFERHTKNIRAINEKIQKL